ncbi:hypothetical protein APR41_17710 [Salegentibacter salinarum]|uniref:LamG-like jellyroll fold domain-containing protein n=1 Tax=Salegentibacter salinarum TaxID=447422 RepID=A0A2N0TVF3_9FLAO|nr:LamG domain-containing protein [Salegentibacter salinarum]PKD18745.1 hypothetical protein APR41_17710 [Salegentibacter salinarum]SKB98516.1 Concanavalin A-like lectin/glucanases superfamily protein [Salegentibacter salinarum]
MQKVLFFLVFFHCGFSLNSQNLTDGLIGHWPLDGDAIDLTINGNDGEVHGAIGVSNRFGEESKAMYFDGNDYIEISNIPTMGTGDFSMSAWFKYDSGAKGELAILSKAKGQNVTGRYAFGIEDSRIRAFIDFGPEVDFRSPTILESNGWSLATVTYDRDGQLRIYANGVLDGSRDISASASIDFHRDFSFLIGQYIKGMWAFKGALDDIRIYNRVLTPTEVEALYTLSSESSECTGLITEVDGNVGVGVNVENSCGYGLAVGGSIYTDEMKVMGVSNWPDYVFSEAYKLMDLGVVTSYIKKYGHLPGLPSAKKVFSDGLSLIGADKANLRKMEELTLYLLDQRDRLDRLRSSKVLESSGLMYSSVKESDPNFVLHRNQFFFAVKPNDSLSSGLSCQGENVGINTSNTGDYRLGVTRGILSQGVKIESVSNWPDYVFSSDYSLRSLDELEEYIEANRHLPGIPSVKTIEIEGYSLSEMDRLLMEKIEELTLYIIDQGRHLMELSKKLGVDFSNKSYKWQGTSEKSLADAFGSHSKDNTKKEVKNYSGQILAGVSGTPEESICDVIICNGEEVGIGTDPVEGYRLAVDGGILTDDIQVASVSNWPDYVFGADYKLRSLSNLSAYIEREGHLPGVPKAEFIEEEGYHLEAMDALLLEKIEELTLYLIGHERQLAFLESRQ